MAGQRHLTGDSAAKGEAAVGGQVRDIQDGIAQKQSQRNEGVDAAQLERGLDDVERKDTASMVCSFYFNVISVSLPLDKAGLRHPASASCFTLASCWPRPTTTPVSTTGGSRRCCPTEGASGEASETPKPPSIGGGIAKQ